MLIQPIMVMAWASLEFLGPQKRVGEIGEQAGGDERAEPIFESHGVILSEPVAQKRVADGQGEKDQGKADHEYVEHVKPRVKLCRNQGRGTAK
jgi:hypothetical protein